jgi:hypothetical protein
VCVPFKEPRDRSAAGQHPEIPKDLANTGNQFVGIQRVNPFYLFRLLFLAPFVLFVQGSVHPQNKGIKREHVDTRNGERLRVC